MASHCNRRLTGDDEEDEDLPGFRFHPTDDELLTFYLRKRVDGKPHSFQYLISDLDIYKHDPWDLPRMAILGEGEREWYFFVPRDKKYKNSNRPNRVTKSGFWKATGTDKAINSLVGCIGLKKSLVFYMGKASRGTKTDWMMHEFRFPSPPDCSHTETCWAVCRIFKRKCRSKNRDAETSTLDSVNFCPNLEAHRNANNNLGETLTQEDSKAHNTSHTVSPSRDSPVSNQSQNQNQPVHAFLEAITQIKDSELVNPDSATSMDEKKLKLKMSKTGNDGRNLFDGLTCPIFTPLQDARPFDHLKYTSIPWIFGDGTTFVSDHLFRESGPLSWSPLSNIFLWDQSNS